MPTEQITVVMASNRPKWLTNCLVQYHRQSTGGLRTELVVACEGHRNQFDKIARHFGIKKYFHSDTELGNAGAAAKDLGLQHATGEYVCFWDDDNVYYDHALATLYASVVGYDLAIVQAGIAAFGFMEIPLTEEITFGNVDTMCFCVRRSLAVQEKWADHQGSGTDFAWISKIMKHNPTYRFVDIKIGEHLN